MRKFRHLSFFTSSFSLFCYILIIFLSFSFVRILPSGLEEVMLITYFFNFAGMIAGIIFCSRIMPLPDKERPLSGGMILIFTVIAAQFIIRAFGVQRWIDSAPLRAVLAVFSGMSCTMVYGLYFLSWLRGNRFSAKLKHFAVKSKSSAEINPSNFRAENRTGRYCPLIFSAALTFGTIANIASVRMLESMDPLAALAVLFNIIKWILPFFGAALAATLFFLKKSFNYIDETKPVISRKADNIQSSGRIASQPRISGAPPGTEYKTNRILILRLLGLACVFTILNGVMEMQLFPLVTNSPFFRPNFIFRAFIVIIFGFFAGRNINAFVSIYLVPGIVIFILMSCLPLLREYSFFIIILSTLVTSYHHSSWAVFSAAVVENYGGDKHFYGVAVSIQFCSIFSFFSPLFSRFLHGSPEFIVLYSAIAAAVFVLLSFRVIFPALTIGKLKTQYILFNNYQFFVKQDKKAVSNSPLPELKQKLTLVSNRRLMEAAQLKKRAPEVPASDNSAQPEKISFNEFLYKHNLSKREIDVAKLMITEGLDTEEIAQRLFISLPTVKNHITNIYKKFNVKKRGEFMAMFVKLYSNVSPADQK